MEIPAGIITAAAAVLARHPDWPDEVVCTAAALAMELPTRVDMTTAIENIARLAIDE